MAKRGRPKLVCSLGRPKVRCFLLYDYEYLQMRTLFEKLKRVRKKYQRKEEEQDETTAIE